MKNCKVCITDSTVCGSIETKECKKSKKAAKAIKDYGGKKNANRRRKD